MQYYRQEKQYFRKNTHKKTHPKFLSQQIYKVYKKKTTMEKAHIFSFSLSI